MRINNNWILAAAFAVVAAFVVAGCVNKAEPAAGTDQTKTSANDQPAQTTLVDFTNDKGEIVCPVTGDVISDKSKAVGHEDYNGKTYYFCCNDCPAKFHADPAKYEDGKAMGSGDTMDKDDMGSASSKSGETTK